MNLMLKFAYVFAGLAFLVSFLFGLFGGVRFSSILFTSLLSALLSAALGAGVHRVLEQKVPESLSLFQTSLAKLRVKPILSLKKKDQNTTSKDEVLDLETKDSSLPLREGRKEGSASPRSENKEGYGTHLMIDKIKVKNEPKILAEAVRTMILSEDGTDHS